VRGQGVKNNEQRDSSLPCRFGRQACLRDLSSSQSGRARNDNLILVGTGGGKQRGALRPAASLLPNNKPSCHSELPSGTAVQVGQRGIFLLCVELLHIIFLRT